MRRTVTRKCDPQGDSLRIALDHQLVQRVHELDRRREPSRTEPAGVGAELPQHKQSADHQQGVDDVAPADGKASDHCSASQIFS